MLESRGTGSYIWAIAVGEQYRNQGLGGCLLEEAELWARENKKTHIQLTVNANNRAQKLYFDAGYRVTGFLRHIHTGAGDGLLMKKGL
jgi:ribosomal protein S18 acetylase RimI-like enzyme